MATIIEKQSLHIPAAILVILGLTACDLRQEPNLPAWENTIEFPIAREVVALDELLGSQDEINPQPFGADSIYAYRQTVEMDTQEVSDQLLLDDMVQSFTQSVDDVTVAGSAITDANGFDAVGVDPVEENISSQVGTISLDDIPSSTTDPFLLNEIVPAVNDLPDAMAVIPESDLVPISKPFTFDDFQSATFSAGDLDITINNDMVIALGSPITIQLQEDTGTDTIDISGASVTWNTSISTGTSDMQTMDLTGITLPGAILVQITGHSNGSEGAEINIDDDARTSSFTVEISGTGLEVSTAQAKIPSQNISEQGNIELAESENKVQRAEISEGTLAINIINAMAVESDLTITIPSLEDADGNAFEETIDLDANETTNSPFDLSGSFMVMDLETQEIQYSYDIATVDTDPDFVTLSEDDSVVVTIQLYGDSPPEQIIFSEITGIIEPQEISEAGDIDVSSDSKILTAEISGGTIFIDINNQVNQSGFAGLPSIDLTIPELLDPSGSPLNRQLTLQPGDVNSLPIDLSDHTLVFPDTATQLLTYTTLVTTPSGELGRYRLVDSIYVNIDMDTLRFSSVTGYFDQDALVDSSAIELAAGTQVLEAVFRTGEIELQITNRIGIEADVDFALKEFIDRNTGVSFGQQFTIGPETTPQVFGPFGLENFDLQIHPDSSQEIHYTSRISIPSEDEMTLTFGDSLIVDVDIRDLSLQSVTGIIEADTLVIEPTEQEIAMPDLVADLQFEEVQILIDFDTEITIPIQLNLELTAMDSTGMTVTKTISQNITENDSVFIPEAEELLNLHPETITASGSAIIGDGVTAGTVGYGQSLSSVMEINVPLSLIIDDPPYVEADPSFMEAPLPDEDEFELREVTLFADITNEFDFGADVVVLVSPDSLSFDSVAIAQGTAPLDLIDTLISLAITPASNELQEISLDENKLGLLEVDQYMQTKFQLLGREDGDGNPLPSRFLTTDSLVLRAWGHIEILVDLEGDEL